MTARIADRRRASGRAEFCHGPCALDRRPPHEFAVFSRAKPLWQLCPFPGGPTFLVTEFRILSRPPGNPLAFSRSFRAPGVTKFRELCHARALFVHTLHPSRTL